MNTFLTRKELEEVIIACRAQILLLRDAGESMDRQVNLMAATLRLEQILAASAPVFSPHLRR